MELYGSGPAETKLTPGTTGCPVLATWEGGGWADVHLLINLTNLMHMWLLLIKLVYI